MSENNAKPCKVKKAGDRKRDAPMIVFVGKQSMSDDELMIVCVVVVGFIVGLIIGYFVTPAGSEVNSFALNMIIWGTVFGVAFPILFYVLSRVEFKKR